MDKYIDTNMGQWGQASGQRQFRVAGLRGTTHAPLVYNTHCYIHHVQELGERWEVEASEVSELTVLSPRVT